MAKNIIICSDGTGNSAIKDRGTNVFKLFESIDINGQRTDPTLKTQVVLYDDGVGTEDFLPLKLLGGAFGWGLKRNVLKLYTGLVRIYDPGDQIYLFGFSRGAFTVRTLAGLIAKCGIPDWIRAKTTDDMVQIVQVAYSTYRQGYRTWLWRTIYRKSLNDVKNSAKKAMTAFRDTHGVRDARIRFVGVWDTVDSVGGPFHISDAINTLIHCFKFPDRYLSEKIDYAAQALSIDDARAAFEPVLWEEQENVEQVWFAGVHANVGGGYPKQGMSLVALNWMLQKAISHGLRIAAADKKLYSDHANVDDKLYDSRAGLGVFYRWKPRDIQELYATQKSGSVPAIHLSVVERIAHGTDGYAPGTLPSSLRVVFPLTGDAKLHPAVEERARLVESTLNQILGRRTYLERVRGTLALGKTAYYLYATSFLLAILGAGIPAQGGLRISPWMVFKNIALLVMDAFSGRWLTLVEAVKRLFSEPGLFGIVLVGFAIAAGLAYYVRHVRDREFSRYWHAARRQLRDVLEGANGSTAPDDPDSLAVRKATGGV